MATEITSDELRAWSGIIASDSATDAAIDEAVNSANSLIDRRVISFPSGWPSEIHTAALIQAARIFKRRGSPEGVANFGDFGPVIVSRLDPDIEADLSPFLKVPFA
jgi:hypothetical protein